MRFFQKKLVVSYAAIAFSVVWAIITIISVRFIGEKVFWGYMTSGGAVGVMFENPPALSEPYRSYPFAWPYSATYGLLAEYNIGESWQNIIIRAAMVIGVLVVVFFGGFVLSVAHMAIRKILYGNMVLERGKIAWYVRKTVFWNTVFTAGLGLIYSFRLSSAMSAMDVTLGALLFFTILTIVVLSRQHALNKQVSADWQSEKEVGNA